MVLSSKRLNAALCGVSANDALFIIAIGGISTVPGVRSRSFYQCTRCRRGGENALPGFCWDAVDFAGSAFVTGARKSPNFPVMGCTRPVLRCFECLPREGRMLCGIPYGDPAIISFSTQGEPGLRAHTYFFPSCGTFPESVFIASVNRFEHSVPRGGHGLGTGGCAHVLPLSGPHHQIMNAGAKSLDISFHKARFAGTNDEPRTSSVGNNRRHT